jgi:uncharacterized membrane protein
MTARRALVAALPFGLAAFVFYTAIGLVTYAGRSIGKYDTGVFSQAAQRWTEGRLPGSGLVGVDNLFADHFSPVTAVFGVAWAIWHDPRGLIVAQALAVGLSVVIVATTAFRLLPAAAALLVIVVAGAAKGVVALGLFQVHEVGLGMPLVAGLASGLLLRNRVVAVACALGLLLVKEDLGATVATAGVIWWFMQRDRRTALALVAAGVVGLAVAFGVLALVNPHHLSPQLLHGARGGIPEVLLAQVSGHSRLEPFALFALTAGLVGLRSPVALLAAPTLAWRLLSSYEAHWATFFHYDGPLVPIAAVALTDVLSRRSVVPLPSPRSRLLIAVPTAGLAVAMGVSSAVTVPIFDPAAYRPSPQQQAASALARTVPAGDAIVVPANLAPPLVARLDVRLLSTLPAGPARWVLVTRTERAQATWLRHLEARPGVQITADGDMVLVRLPVPEVVRLPDSGEPGSLAGGTGSHQGGLLSCRG